MQIIIFSYNRAMQLAALIHSFLKWWNNGDYKIDVIYNSSSDEYEKGYTLLQNELSSNSNVHFYKERKVSCTQWSIAEFSSIYNLKLLYLCPFLRRKKTDFRKILLERVKASGYKCMMFLTDDTIFVRAIEYDSRIEEWILSNPKQNQYSFRHGEELVRGGDVEMIGNKYEWTFSKFSKSNHWGYNFSLDGHVYGTDFLYEFLNHMTFSNPNTLESAGIMHANKRAIFNNGRCGKNVCLLSFPINIVQQTFNNKALNADIAILNEYFLRGFHLKYNWKEIQEFQQYPKYIEMYKEDVSIWMEIKE